MADVDNVDVGAIYARKQAIVGREAAAFKRSAALRARE